MIENSSRFHLRTKAEMIRRQLFRQQQELRLAEVRWHEKQRLDEEMRYRMLEEEEQAQRNMILN